MFKHLIERAQELQKWTMRQSVLPISEPPSRGWA
jgi:hypothetical protein